MLKNRFSKSFSLFYFIDSRLRGNDNMVYLSYNCNSLAFKSEDDFNQEFIKLYKIKQKKF